MSKIDKKKTDKDWLPLLLRMEPSTKTMLQAKAKAHDLSAAAFIRKLIEDAPSKPGASVKSSNGHSKKSPSASKGWETRRANKAAKAAAPS